MIKQAHKVQQRPIWNVLARSMCVSCFPPREASGSFNFLDILPDICLNVAFSPLCDTIRGPPNNPRKQNRHTFHDIFS